MSKNSQNTISSKDQEMFEKGIGETKKRWEEPDIVKFEADFRRTWQSKRQHGSDKNGSKEEEKIEQSFEEEENDELSEIEMSLQNISSKYNDIDYD